MKRAEVLAPVGSAEALTAALRCGADAVYFGGARFNARENASHFSGDALREAVENCHARGVRVYLTLNTLLRGEEQEEALSLAEEACALGVDALIVQDLGLARRLRACAPDMPLHASTQLTVHTPAGVALLRDSGFTRVVLAREMSRQEIAACASLGCELEVFVHGALCMSVSGQCYFSAMLGGRSGNRGLCAQPCRLPFRAEVSGCGPGTLPRPAGEGEAALSLRDLSLREHLADLQERGVCSLKIEGRMKRPEYVAAATAVCAAAVRGETADPQLLDDLQSVFSRSGFTDGYYIRGRRDTDGCPAGKSSADRRRHSPEFLGEDKCTPGHPSQISRGRNSEGFLQEELCPDGHNSSMFGIRRKEDVIAAAPVLSRLSRLYGKEMPRVPVRMELTLQAKEPARLSVFDGESGGCIQVEGPVPERAEHRPLDEGTARRQLEKTGGTPFYAVSCTAAIGEGLTLPASALNSLRREALERLYRLRARRPALPFDPAARPGSVEGRRYAVLERRPDGPALAARCADREQGLALSALPGDERPALLIVPLTLPAETLAELAAAGPLAVEIPRGMFGIEDSLRRRLAIARRAGAESALCGTVGALPLAKEAGLLPVGGFGLNLWNGASADQLAEWGASAAVASMELTFRQLGFLQRMAIPGGLLAYGRQPLMLTRNCPVQCGTAADACAACGRRGGLVDRKGIRFPVRCELPGGCSEVLNSTPLYLADRLAELPAVDFLLLHFTGETPEEAAEVLREYRGGGPPRENITRGLYRRGVE